MTDDPLIEQLRREISDLDRSIVAAMNERLELVARLKRHKDAQGLGFLDPDREAAMLQDLRRRNTGPLSDDGLKELFDEVLDLTKREVGRAES